MTGRTLPYKEKLVKLSLHLGSIATKLQGVKCDHSLQECFLLLGQMQVVNVLRHLGNLETLAGGRNHRSELEREILTHETGHWETFGVVLLVINCLLLLLVFCLFIHIHRDLFLHSS